jgi:hypothetical protein
MMPKKDMPCRTIIVDSSEYAALMMNSEKPVRIGFNIEWLGRSGIVEINGVRIAHISGVDSDILGHQVMQVDATSTYIGNYFTQADVEKVL